MAVNFHNPWIFETDSFWFQVRLSSRPLIVPLVGFLLLAKAFPFPRYSRGVFYLIELDATL